MKQACIRCVVQLSLDELHWTDENGINVALAGPPLFVRACILGQLQHSHLQKPLFPVAFNQTLTFDRVLTNCRNPSLFGEVIRGEHVKVECIQISPDYKGGKILAKFDCPAHDFLFPDNDAGQGTKRTIVLDHARHYKVYPELDYTSSTVLLEATVKSPINVLLPDSGSSSEEAEGEELEVESLSDDADMSPRRKRMNSMSTRRSSHARSLADSPRRLSQAKTGAMTAKQMYSSYPEPRVSRDTSPSVDQKQVDVDMLDADADSSPVQEKLRTLLSNYAERVPYPLTEEGPSYSRRQSGSKREEAKSRRRYQSFDSRGLYFSPCSLVGKHDWEDCPRRSTKTQMQSETHSAPTSPMRRRRSQSYSLYHHKCVPNSETMTMVSGGRQARNERDRSKSMPDLRPQFVVRRADGNLISERNFCGVFGKQASDADRSQGIERGGHRTSRSKQGTEDYSRAGRGYSTDRRSTYKSRYGGIKNGRGTEDDRHVKSGHRNKSEGGAEKREGRKTSFKKLDFEGVQWDQEPPQQSSSSPCLGSKDTTQKGSPRWSPLERFQSPNESPREQFHSPGRNSAVKSILLWSPEPPRSQPAPMPAPIPVVDPELMSRYLPQSETYQKSAQAYLPRSKTYEKKTLAETIEEKIERLRKECCVFLRHADQLGEDSLTEDLDRLQASLQGERDAAQAKSERELPDKSVLVELGPREYWSQRAAEMRGGTRHRVIFDETLQKIYNKLYTDASINP